MRNGKPSKSGTTDQNGLLFRNDLMHGMMSMTVKIKLQLMIKF